MVTASLRTTARCLTLPTSESERLSCDYACSRTELVTMERLGLEMFYFSFFLLGINWVILI